MPAKETKNKKEESKNFIEFSEKFGEIKLSGRMYKGEANKGIERNYLSLCVNDLFTISGCHLVETSSTYFISFPQYTVKKDGKDTYKSYVFVEKDSKFQEALDELSKVLFDKKKEF